MLLQLEITNIALIEYVSIDFEKGLNVLTGETGAGKSIIIDSINAVLGGRITRDLIRTGCESASVNAVFNYSSKIIEDLFAENGIGVEEDGTIIVSREFNTQGRNICRVNGRVVPLSFLRQTGTQMVDVHGQHDNQSLLNVVRHIELLDAFCGSELTEILEDYCLKLTKYRELKGNLDKLLSGERERVAKLDLLNYQIKDIEHAKLKKCEEIGRAHV